MSLLLLAAVSIVAWTPWAHRPEIAPQTTRAGSTWTVAGNGNPASHGGWVGTIAGVQPGQWYRISAVYRAQNVGEENLHVTLRMDWSDAQGKRAGQPDYAWQRERRDGWTALTAHVPAPEKATGGSLQLFLSNAPQGRVEWRDVKVEEATPPPPRPVTIATVNLRPDNTGSREASLAAFTSLVDQRVTGKVDLIVLPEGATVVGTGKTYVEVAESVPGPTTQLLGKLAVKHNAWIVAGLYERDGAAVYNTSVLLDRTGRYVGKYRKVYLPREEIERGLTPGSSYPVFTTDFGTLGMMICYDSFYADPARALALKGAEIVAVPIWGGNEQLMKARAIENRVFVVSSGYDYPTHVLDPDGKIIAAAKDRGTVAIVTVDLAKRYTDQWLGDMRQRFHHEIRFDVPVR